MFENVKYLSCGKFISDGEWIHPDRTINSYELLYVTKGNVYINENDIEYSLGEHEFLVLEPNMRHYGYKHSQHTEFFWLHWYGVSDITSLTKHSKLENQYAFILFFKQLLHNRIEKVLDESFDYLTRLILIEVCSKKSGEIINHIAEKIVSWIKANNYKPISVSQIAEHFGYNADYLNRIFKESYTKSIKQCIDEERMNFIKNLLLINKQTLREIAEISGFKDYKYFLKFFKYHENITPTEFQKLYSNVYINTH